MNALQKIINDNQEFESQLAERKHKDIATKLASMITESYEIPTQDYRAKTIYLSEFPNKHCGIQISSDSKSCQLYIPDFIHVRDESEALSKAKAMFKTEVRARIERNTGYGDYVSIFMTVPEDFESNPKLLADIARICAAANFKIK